MYIFYAFFSFLFLSIILEFGFLFIPILILSIFEIYYFFSNIIYMILYYVISNLEIFIYIYKHIFVS